MAKRARGECQICGGDQALTKAGKLGNHGYTRPGWGYIRGNCAGVGHEPFPATDALVAWRQRVAEQAGLLEMRLAGDTVPANVEVGRGGYVGKTYVPKTRLVTNLEDFLAIGSDPEVPVRFQRRARNEHDWERVQRDARWKLGNDLAAAEAELAHIDERLATAEEAA